MGVNRKINEALEKLSFRQREEGIRHHTYDEDIRQYEYIRNGDMRAIEEGRRMFEGPTTGSLSDDPVVNYIYLFTASITLACRFCIEGGMQPEVAFNLSDLYIRQVDKCRTVQEIFSLHDTMFRDYTSRMKQLLHQEAYSRPVHRCLDIIEQELQQPMTVESLAEKLALSPSYLSTLFKRETGVAVSEYIRRRRIDTAKMLLVYTDFSCVDIAEYLCFSSDSHLSRVFRSYTGLTPTQYRKQNYRRHWTGSSAPDDAR